MRTRGAFEDLVVVDLDDPDDPDEVTGPGPHGGHRHFEDRYAELPFGLGTVPRRLDRTPWYARPGTVLWLALALVGLLALVSSGTGPARDGGSAPSLPTLRTRTGATLVLVHDGAPVALDVDRRTFRVLLGADHPAGPRDLVATQGSTSSATPVVSAFVHGRWQLIASAAFLLGTGRDLVVWRPLQCADVCPVRITDVRRRRTTTLLTFDPRRAGVSRVSVAPDDGAVAVFGVDGRPGWRLVDLRRGVVGHVDLRDSGVPASAWSRDGRRLFVADGADLLVIGRDGTARRVDVVLPPFEQLTTG